MNDSDFKEQSESMRRLARGLLYDRGNADDVVQDAWLVSLSKAPREGFSLRAWLAGTVRRMAMDRNRSESSRKERERVVAREERLPSHVESTSRIEVLRRVVDGVDTLEEPYRETVLLRFFDDLSLKAIAKRQGVPLETVRTRLRRGLQRLRETFDREHRDAGGDARGAFLAALFPMAGEIPWRTALAVPSGSTLATSTGVMGMAKDAELFPELMSTKPPSLV